MKRQNPQYDIITPDTIRDMKACDRSIEIKINQWTDYFLQCISRENKITKSFTMKALLEYCQFLYERDTLKVDFTDHTIFKDYKNLQRRFERLNEEAEIAFYRRISDRVNEIFLKFEDLQGIFVGGPGPSKDKFVKLESLDYRLRDKIFDTVDIGYGGVEGIRALIEKVKGQIENVKYIREKEAMQRFMKEISSETGLATYGLEEIQRALNYGVVSMLLLSEKLDTYYVKLGCSNCDYSENRTIKKRSLDKFKRDIQEENCPKCSSNSFKIIEINSIIEELGVIAESTGTDVEILSTETEYGEMLYSTFGGIAAILRYKIDY